MRYYNFKLLLTKSNCKIPMKNCLSDGSKYTISLPENVPICDEGEYDVFIDVLQGQILKDRHEIGSFID